MSENKSIKILKRIFLVCLPFIGAVFANVAVLAHFKNFCLIKLLTHHECWGCGLTRAFAEFSRFHFIEAYNYNHLIIVIIPVLVLLWIMLLKKEFSN